MEWWEMGEVYAFDQIVTECMIYSCKLITKYGVTFIVWFVVRVKFV